MCGIAGFVDFRKKTKEKIIKTMTNILYHRGPDSEGYSFYSTELANIGLGHRRLSILDLSPLGNQPMKFEHLEIVYNGEIYNYKEIRKELESYGYNFISNTDTEVILKAFHKWDIKAVHKFIGMFAMAIYDKKKQRLILIRDRVGIKPLYYYYKDGLFLFASELKSFHKHPDFKKDINMYALSLFFRFGYIIQPYSIFQNTWKLKTGHYGILNLKNGNFKEVKYWNVVDFYNKPKLKIDFQEAVEETERLLKSAFKYRMISDVPVGLFLSGGYDSSTVAAILQKEINERIKTFTIGFYENEFNEAHYAREVAKYLKTEHTEYYCSQKEALEIIPLIPEIYDEPFGDPSLISTILVSKLARQKVKVALSADGGDEIFGGYPKYIKSLKYFSIFSKIPFRNKFAVFFNFLNPDFLRLYKANNFYIKYRGKLKEFLLAKNPISVMNTLVSYFSEEEIEKLLGINNNKLIETSFDKYVKFFNNYNNDIDKMMAIDYITYLPDDLLVKVDRATMSVSLEGREPLLDHRIIEFIAQLPSTFKIRGATTKFLLKKIAHKYIPEKLINRPKMGFMPPYLKWLENDLYDSIQESMLLLEKEGFLNSKYVKKIFYYWKKGVKTYTKKIWLLWIFHIWTLKWKI